MADPAAQFFTIDFFSLPHQQAPVTFIFCYVGGEGFQMGTKKIMKEFKPVSKGDCGARGGKIAKLDFL